MRDETSINQTVVRQVGESKIEEKSAKKNSIAKNSNRADSESRNYSGFMEVKIVKSNFQNGRKVQDKSKIMSDISQIINKKPKKSKAIDRSNNLSS